MAAAHLKCARAINRNSIAKLSASCTLAQSSLPIKIKVQLPVQMLHPDFHQAEAELVSFDTANGKTAGPQSPRTILNFQADGHEFHHAEEGRET